MLLLLLLLHRQVLILTEETQLLGCFMVFVGTVYSQAGDAIGKALDAKGESVMAEHNAQEEVEIAAAKAVIESHKNKLSLVGEMVAVSETQTELLSMLAAAKSMELQYQLRADIVKKLDYIAAKEDIAKAKQQALLAASAAAAVKSEFLATKELQTKALTEAIAAIEDPSKATSTDVVGSLFSGHFSKVVSAVKSSTAEVELPAEVIEEAKAEIIAMRKRDGNMDETVEGLPTKVSLASL